MVTKDDTKHLFAYVRPGEEHECGRRLIPVITTAGAPEEEDGDGAQHLRVPVRRLLRNVGVINEDNIFEAAQAALYRPILFAASDFELVVTDARIVIIGKEIRPDGSRLVGQIRNPWIHMVQFRPKQSFWNDSEVVIDTWEDFDIDLFPERRRGVFAHSFTFVFDKKYHPGELARAIAVRAAQYVESTQGVPSSPELSAMRSAAPLPDPSKGEHSSYKMPKYCSVPNGIFGLGDGHDYADWLGDG